MYSLLYMKFNWGKAMKNVTYRYAPAIVFIMLLFTVSAISNTYASDYCVSCHRDPKFQVSNKVLFDYYNYWEESVHESADIICIDCHGGNESKPDKETAHDTKDFSSLTARDSGSHKKIALVCGKCHKAVYKNFKTSRHYAALQEEKNTPNCVTCHGSMNTEIYSASNIAGKCKLCHNERSRQTPEVSGQAEDLLTRINFIRAYKKWVTINYRDDLPQTVKDINSRYKDMVLSWHQFDFTRMTEKTKKLLIDLRALVNKGLAEKKKGNK